MCMGGGGCGHWALRCLHPARCSWAVLLVSGAEARRLFYLEGWCCVLFAFPPPQKKLPVFSELNTDFSIPSSSDSSPFKYSGLRVACLSAVLMRLIKNLNEISGEAD